MSDSSFPVIYQLKVVLLGISPMIWRRLKVSSDSTIFRFALHTTDSNGVGRHSLASFHHSWKAVSSEETISLLVTN